MLLKPLLPPHFFFWKWVKCVYFLLFVCMCVYVFKEKEKKPPPFQDPVSTGRGGGWSQGQAPLLEVVEQKVMALTL